MNKNIIHERLDQKATWLVTGAAGFIGSNLCEVLLQHGQKVVGLDNFATGHKKNIDDINKSVGTEEVKNFSFIEGDVTDRAACEKGVAGADYVLHQAALGSVPKSIEDPRTWNLNNVTGTLEMLIAARDQKSVKGFVYASSSSVYGDSPDLPKKEEKIGKQLSPYAASKYADELYAQVFSSCYAFPSVGLRYFNVFGKRQDPKGAYAAVIPKWLEQMMNGEQCTINGDGETSRDFCFIDNVVQANIKSAFFAASRPAEMHTVFNVGAHEQTDLKTLHALLAEAMAKETNRPVADPHFAPFRAGDIRHSLANIDKIKSLIGYAPTHTIRDGVTVAIPWYVQAFRSGF